MENSVVSQTMKGLVLATAAVALGQAALAQDFTTFRGNNQRTGTPTLAPSTPPNPPSVWNNPGR